MEARWGVMSSGPNPPQVDSAAIYSAAPILQQPTALLRNNNNCLSAYSEHHISSSSRWEVRSVTRPLPHRSANRLPSLAPRLGQGSISGQQQLPHRISSAARHRHQLHHRINSRYHQVCFRLHLLSNSLQLCSLPLSSQMGSISAAAATTPAQHRLASVRSVRWGLRNRDR